MQEQQLTAKRTDHAECSHTYIRYTNILHSGPPTLPLNPLPYPIDPDHHCPFFSLATSSSL